jgi:hypothetical protein
MHPNKIMGWLSGNKVVIETMLVAAVVVSVWFNYSQPGGDPLLMITMVTLAAFYFVSAYFIPDAGELLAIVSTKVLSISSAVCIVGILFTILNLTGALEMLMIGVISLVSAGVLVGYYAVTSWSPNYLVLLVRTVLLGGITIKTFLDLRGVSD